MLLGGAEASRRRSFGWVLVGPTRPTPTPNGTERGKLHRRCHARRVQFNHHQGVELIPASNDETKGGSSQIRSTERRTAASQQIS